MAGAASALVFDIRPSHSAATVARRISVTVIALLMVLACCRSLHAQAENFLVSSADGTLSLYDLATNSLLESFQSSPLTYTISSSPNGRLAFSAGGSGYGLATDTSIGRDITRLTGVRAPASTTGHSGQYYLAADYNYVLDVVSTATLTIVQKVDFSSVIPRIGNPGAIVSANDQAYIFPRTQNPQAPKAAVVNLTTFQLSSIALPPGTVCRRCASRTPDGSIVVVIEQENSDGKSHVLLINTATNIIVKDFSQTQAYGSRAFVVTRSTDPAKLYGYLAVFGRVLAVDLQPNSPTYGQVLAGTAVTLTNSSIPDVAISSDGSRLILAEAADSAPPRPTVDVVDTGKMLTDPAHALVAQLVVNGGISASTVCTGFFVTTPPNTAPTVSTVSGDITNDKDNDITVTGGNFQAGALVRIGSLPQLPATVMGSNTLTVTVPAGAPAGKAQDIIVTNPLTNDPPTQQNQSGVLAGQFNILPNPKFQPATQFATSNDSLLFAYDLKQQTMVNIHTGTPGDLSNGISFNVDGKYLYLASVPNYGGNDYVLPINLDTNTAASPITLPSNTYVLGQLKALAAGRDPQTNTPVQYVLWTDDTDMRLGKIDSDPASDKFNTLVQTFNANLNFGFAIPYTITLSPDGKFAYVWYIAGKDYMGVFNLSTGAFTSISATNLGVTVTQSQIGIAPDGKSMLLATSLGSRVRIKVFDISNPISPKLLTQITPLPIPNFGFPQVFNYQVIGTKLYAIDLNGAAVVFNFDRSKGDFRQRGYVAGSQSGYSNFAFSPDGSYIYLTDYYNDAVLVGDVGKLAGGDPSVTSIRSPYTPYLIDVSPVAPPSRIGVHPRPIESRERRTEAVQHGVLPD